MVTHRERRRMCGTLPIRRFYLTCCVEDRVLNVDLPNPKERSAAPNGPPPTFQDRQTGIQETQADHLPVLQKGVLVACGWIYIAGQVLPTVGGDRTHTLHSCRQAAPSET